MVWKGKLTKKPGNPGINSDSEVTEYSSPFKVFQVIFNNGIFKILCDKTNRANKHREDSPSL
jgi:hypothetical protein